MCIQKLLKNLINFKTQQENKLFNLTFLHFSLNLKININYKIKQY